MPSRYIGVRGEPDSPRVNIRITAFSHRRLENLGASLVIFKHAASDPEGGKLTAPAYLFFLFLRPGRKRRQSQEIFSSKTSGF